MSVLLKIKLAKAKLFIKAKYKQAKKIAFAVLLAECILTGLYSWACYSGVYERITGKKVIYIQVAQEQKKAESPEVSEQDKLIKYIWQKESGSGRKNYSKCEAIGQFNGIGFGIDGTGKYVCFETEAEQFQVLAEWIQGKKSQGFNERELLCIYNTGKTRNGLCDYSQGFIL